VRRGISEHIRGNVVGYVALFIALSGGTAWATHEGGANTIGSGDIIDNEVDTPDIRDGAVTTGKLADGAVTEEKLGCGSNPDDVMVKVGSVCVDRYEASIWDAPTGGNQITGEVPCDRNGQDCDDIYARSVPGVTPASNISWFQAQQALANSGKRLPTNAEWQMAAAGTPDSTDCNVSTGSVANSGANAACVSNWGVNDMVGNLGEWVADWDEEAIACAAWPPGFGDDVSCLGRASAEPSTRHPGALVRGGDFADGVTAGPFALSGIRKPRAVDASFGFRGAR
jgi:formylglycine-generating enzyme required for sulfatase activity